MLGYEMMTNCVGTPCTFVLRVQACLGMVVGRKLFFPHLISVVKRVLKDNWVHSWTCSTWEVGRTLNLGLLCQLGHVRSRLRPSLWRVFLFFIFFWEAATRLSNSLFLIFFFSHRAIKRLWGLFANPCMLSLKRSNGAGESQTLADYKHLITLCKVSPSWLIKGHRVECTWGVWGF